MVGERATLRICSEISSSERGAAGKLAGAVLLA